MTREQALKELDRLEERIKLSQAYAKLMLENIRLREENNNLREEMQQMTYEHKEEKP